MRERLYQYQQGQGGEPTIEQAVGVDLYALRASIGQQRSESDVTGDTNAESQRTLADSIEYFTKRIIENNKVTAQTLENVFAVPSNEFSHAQIEYFKSYVEIAVRELVFGAVEVLRRRRYSESEIMEILDSGRSPGYVFVGDLIFHDVMHTVLQIGMSKGTTPGQMRPLFQREPLEDIDRDSSSYITHTRAIQRDEMGALLWYRVTSGLNNQREETIELIKKSSSEEEFIKNYFASFDHVWTTAHSPDHLKEIHPFLRNVLGRVYREFETNPKLLYTIFQETTLQFMKTNNPKAASAVSGQT